MEDKKPKMSREFELQRKITGSEQALRMKLDEVKKSAEAAAYEALIESTRACSVNDKLRKAQISGIVAFRDARKREIEKDYQQALRKAEGERQKAVNEANAKFESQRGEIEVEMTKKNDPFRAQYQKDMQEIMADAENTAKELSNTHQKYILPLVTELDTIMEAKRAKMEEKAVKEAKEDAAALEAAKTEAVQ